MTTQAKEVAPPIPASDWKWFGLVGHFICGQWCRFHLNTQVGDFMVSTIGMYVHPSNSGSSEQQDMKFLLANPDGEDIGYKRKYETMVFRAKPCRKRGCECGGTPVPTKWSELAADGYNTQKAATKGHLAMCLRAAKGEFQKAGQL